MTELWLVELDAAAPALEALERKVPRLAADDRERACRLRDPDQQRHRLAAYMALRIVLERAVGPRVRGQEFVRGPGGKPSLPDGDVAFSLSHIAELALIAVAQPPTMIGVDLEKSHAIGMSARRREEILAAGSGLADVPLSDPVSDATVLQAWCRLEAFAKARGDGVAALLGELGLREPEGRALPITSIEAAARHLARQASLRVGDVELPPGLHGAIAVADLATPLRPRAFPGNRAAIQELLEDKTTPPD